MQGASEAYPPMPIPSEPFGAPTPKSTPEPISESEDPLETMAIETVKPYIPAKSQGFIPTAVKMAKQYLPGLLSSR